MKGLGLILVLAASVCFCQTKTKDVPGAWIVSKVDWTQDDLAKNEKWTTTEVLYFFPDGRFGIVKGSIIQTGKKTEISYGDSQTVYFGSWKRTGNEITIAYKMIYRDIQITGRENTVQQEQIVVNEEGEIVFQDQLFKKEPKLDKSAEFTISEKLPNRKSRVGQP